MLWSSSWREDRDLISRCTCFRERVHQCSSAHTTNGETTLHQCNSILSKHEFVHHTPNDWCTETWCKWNHMNWKAWSWAWRWFNDDSGYDPDSNKTKIWYLRQVKPQKSNCTMAMTSPQVLPILWRKTACDELICVALLSKWTMLFIVVFDDGWYRIIST